MCFGIQTTSAIKKVMRHIMDNSWNVLQTEIYKYMNTDRIWNQNPCTSYEKQLRLLQIYAIDNQTWDRIDTIKTINSNCQLKNELVANYGIPIDPV